MKIIIALIILAVLIMLVIRASRKASAGTPTKVLVCVIGLNNELEGFAKVDADTYRRHYSDVTQTSCTDAEHFFAVLRQDRYRIAHLFLRIDMEGKVNGIGIRTILEVCRRNGAKAIILANDHDPDIYINWVNIEGVNLVMTIERKGNLFPAFWDNLLARLTSGMTMPVAWADLVPQVEGPHQDDKPGCVFSAGAGGETFR